jgi:hypothetical protein
VKQAMKKLLSLASVLLISLVMTVAMATSTWAAEKDDKVSGTISKVEEGGRSIVVKTKDGKETTMKISGSRTKFEGVGDRGELKAGQKVTAEVKGDEATMIKVSK